MKKIILILFIAFGTIDTTNAQCPMCKTAVESGMEDGHTKGKGLNDGILYLLCNTLSCYCFYWKCLVL